MASATEQATQANVQHPAHTEISSFGFTGIAIIFVGVLILMIFLSKLKRKSAKNPKENKPVYSENDRKALNLIVALANLQKKIDSK